jgi:Sec-independent protein translocase protein TatA
LFALFEDLGFPELLVIGIAGILLFGKRLPEVAGQAGQQLVKLRRSLQQVRTETGMDQEVRKIQRTLEEAIPRDLSVGEVARLASARVQERIESARKEIDKEVGQPLAEATAAPAPAPASAPVEPAHDATRVGPPASDATIARTLPPGAPPAEPTPPVEPPKPAS